MDEKQLVEQLKSEHTEKKKGDFPSEQITLPSKGFFYPKENPF